MDEQTKRAWDYDSFKVLCSDCGTDAGLLCLMNNKTPNFLCIECRDKDEDEPEEDEEIDMIDGFYYLHTNGDLIWKVNMDNGQEADFRESDFVVTYWGIDLKDRQCYWTFLVEALAAGAKKERVFELANKNGCNNEDAQMYAKALDLSILPDGNAMGAMRKNDYETSNIQESPCGFGDTSLEALAEFAKALGYKPSKMWGIGFEELIRKTK
ncbi:hypothetical protein MASR1M48_17000 [Lactococcus petauri]